MLNCPQCQTELAKHNEEDSFWQCNACSGVLIAADPLSYEWKKVTTGHAGATSAEQNVEELLNCSTCENLMQSVSGNDFTVQQCLECQLVWMSGSTDKSKDDKLALMNRYMLYGVSLPERAVRSAVGLAAGAARETAGLLVPQAFQSSTSYALLVKNSLRFLAEDIGGVEGEKKENEDPGDEGFLARKAVGNFVDLAGLATLHVSPVWFMAIVSDVAYGSKTYLNELSVELKKQGVIDEDSTINQLDDVLEAVQNATGQAASLFDTPPLSVDQLRTSLDNTRQALKSADFGRILPEQEINQYWSEMKAIAQKEGVSLTGVSGAVTMHALEKVSTVSHGTLTGIQVVGGMFSKHVVGHYINALDNVKQRGLYEVLSTSSAPYVTALWNNFSDSKSTWTEEVLTGRAIGKAFNAVAGWFSKPEELPEEPPVVDGTSTNNEQ